MRTASIDLEKYVSVDGGSTYVDADSIKGPEALLGSNAFFKITLENTGNVTLSGITITDALTTYDSMGNATGTTPINIGSAGFVLYRDFDADGNIDAADIAGGAINSLGVGEFAVGVYELPFVGGQHTNTATVLTTQGAADNDAANYFGLVGDGPGVRTPGFWSNLGAQFWDGNASNQTKSGPGFTENGDLLLYGNTFGTVDSNRDGSVNAGDQGLLIGDYNRNGLTDVGEDTLFISLSDAKKFINSDQTKAIKGDGTAMLTRDAVATWLNYLAGNNLEGTGPDAKDYLDAAVNWLQVYSGTFNSGPPSSTTESFDIFKFAAVKTSSAAWNSTFEWLPHSASTIHGQLDEYNNTGSIDDNFYAGDADGSAFLMALTSLNNADYIL